MKLPLKQLRKDRRITQSELSEALKISPSTVGMWEQGRREPDYEMLKRIADYFNVSTDYLLGRDETVISLSNLQMTLLKMFDRLNIEGQDLIMRIINSLEITHSKENHNLSGIVQKNKINNNYGVVGANFNSSVVVK